MEYVFEEFKPTFAFFQAGVDVLEGDRLGRLKLDLQGLATRDHAVFNACRAAGIPLVVVMGGGYGGSLEDTVLAHAGTVMRAMGSEDPRLITEHF